MTHLRFSHAMTRMPPRVRLLQAAPLKTPVTKYASTAASTMGVIATVYIGGLIHASHSLNFDGGLAASSFSADSPSGLAGLFASVSSAGGVALALCG